MYSPAQASWADLQPVADANQETAPEHDGSDECALRPLLSTFAGVREKPRFVEVNVSAAEEKTARWNQKVEPIDDFHMSAGLVSSPEERH